MLIKPLFKKIIFLSFLLVVFTDKHCVLYPEFNIKESCCVLERQEFRWFIVTLVEICTCSDMFI